MTVSKSLLGEEMTTQTQLLDDLRSIGASNEAIALAVDDFEIQQSASYVAASAYRAIAEASPSSDVRSTSLSTESISAAIASTLLFLIADAAADASEAAASIIVEADDPNATLVELVRLLGRGEVHLGKARATITLKTDEEPSSLIAPIGYWKCERRLLQLIARLDDGSKPEQETEAFAIIAASMESAITFGFDDNRHVVTNRINGPWHLARLLELTEPILLRSATSAIEAPPGVDSYKWSQHRMRISRRRPVLWRNHRDALQRGLLDQGMSAVLAFPTGAGKSTLSELKIIATVLRGRNVICLAPTLSLVDQLARSFRQVAPSATVIAQHDPDEDVTGIDGDGTQIYVMTPESCLATLGIDHERFGDVGLVMFDEAHLMHFAGGEPSRRSIDATLCFLTLAARFPTADLLLVSAMIANADELTNWLETITSRPAIALNSPWKPTRQARGALVYDAQRVRELRQQLDAAFKSSSNQGAPSAIRATMTAVPYGFFSLWSTWESNSIDDYRLVRLLEEPVPLETGGKRNTDGTWWLTPNSNNVAAHIARAAAKSDMKTLVFTHQPLWTASIARTVSNGSTRRTPLAPVERDLTSRIIDALGSESALYLDINGTDVIGDAIPHHGLLLPDERRLHERLYQRADGIPVMVATSTVAQGMNFPSEFVIVASDRRFDPATNTRGRVEAHELLNAAGRAGRAGSRSNALVLVIPGAIVEYGGGTNIGSAWAPLQETFSKSDQCLAFEDPLLPLLGGLDDDDRPPLVDYLARRLDSVSDATIGPELIRSSFLAHTSRGTDMARWIDRKVAQLSAVVDGQDAEIWIRQCSLVSGLPLADIQFIAELLDFPLAETGTIDSWSAWVLDLLNNRPSLAESVLRDGSRSALAGTAEDLDAWSTSGSTLVHHLRELLPRWLHGSSLLEIQRVGISRGLASEKDEKLTFARKFVLRVVPDLAYLFSLPGLIAEQRALLSNTEPLPEGHPLRSIGRCVELGVESAEKVAILEADPRSNRRTVRNYGAPRQGL
ncbi:DEAD/DEAH box helicase [Curtobacterium aurantiacum]|uniref:DEAD/DEAH box helicase n=1 Tax=Curtobacterium aurantiacum TaxID=3236919 RepID=UPI001BE04704|nr:DEAD/DEAH box helicase [Curtobacterium flaccumfaciens]MBT1677016.1 DEAD/DEAH box helicase [Curtobacterium flaccumfaciens pv. flaccumfaciens]